MKKQTISGQKLLNPPIVYLKHMNYLSVFSAKDDKKLDKLRAESTLLLCVNVWPVLTLRKKYLQLLQYKMFSVLKKKNLAMDSALEV